MKMCCGSTLGGCLIAGFLFGAAGLGYLVGQNSGVRSGAPLLALDATASATGEDYSMATGLVSDEAEGVFVLDHTSGLLQCNVLYPRAGQFGAAFQCNVKEALGGAGKNGKYLMVTGTAQFPGGSNRPNANCVVYVLDQNTGAYACYAIPFTKSMVNSGAPQMGVLVPIAVGQARTALDRDALR